MENRTQIYKTKQQKGHNVQSIRKPSSTVSRRSVRESDGFTKNKQTKGSQKFQNNFAKNRNSKGNIRRNKNMFPTDINMRNSDTQAGELQERKRHNRKSEELEERGQNLQMGNTVLKGATGAIGKIGGAILGPAAASVFNHPE